MRIGSFGSQLTRAVFRYKHPFPRMELEYGDRHMYCMNKCTFASTGMEAEGLLGVVIVVRFGAERVATKNAN
jgi:hypothetical protein